MRTKELIKLFEGTRFYYVKDLHKSLIHGMRKLLPENFIPMAHAIVFSPEFYHNHVQVLIDCIGGKAWVTVNKNDIKMGE